IECRKDVVALAARRPRHEQPHQAPQIAQERPVHEVRRIDEQDGPLASLRLFQPWQKLVVEVVGLLVVVGLGRHRPYLAPAQADFFFKKARTWDRPRRMPVSPSIASWASRVLRGGCSMK